MTSHDPGAHFCVMEQAQPQSFGVPIQGPASGLRCHGSKVQSCSQLQGRFRVDFHVRIGHISFNVYICFVQDAEDIPKSFPCKEYVIKAQVLAGGRGKGHFDNGFKVR